MHALQPRIAERRDAPVFYMRDPDSDAYLSFYTPGLNGSAGKPTIEDVISGEQSRFRELGADRELSAALSVIVRPERRGHSHQIPQIQEADATSLMFAAGYFMLAGNKEQAYRTLERSNKLVPTPNKRLVLSNFDQAYRVTQNYAIESMRKSA